MILTHQGVKAKVGFVVVDGAECDINGRFVNRPYAVGAFSHLWDTADLVREAFSLPRADVGIRPYAIDI